MDAVRRASDELCSKLTKSLELMRALTALSQEKETCLQSGNIEGLRAATEKEEELIADLGELEKDRENCAGALSEAIGFFGSGHSLSELIGGIADSEIKKRLTDRKDKLADAMSALTSQNDKLRQLLELQIDYTEYMLNCIYVPKSRGNSYDIQGSRLDDMGGRSFFDFHV